MSLADLKIEKRVVKVAGQEVAVRGLSFADLTKLFVAHAREFNELLVAIADTERGQEAVLKIAIQYLSEKAEVLLAKIIAAAADEPGEYEAVLKIPGPAQLELLMAVVGLTFAEPEAMGKFASNISGLLQMAAPALKTLSEATAQA